MLAPKCTLPFLVLVLVNVTFSKPTDDTYVTEGRGIGSTLWDWITYPFSWWSSEETDRPVQDHLVATSTYGPYDNIEVGRHNVTVWCNDHTCTTMKCDKHGCRNNTCNIYDTNLTGECREYHTDVDPEEPVSTSTSASPKPIDDNKITEDTDINTSSTKPLNGTAPTPAESDKNQNEPETPLELEAVLSSTVTENETSAVHSKDEYSSQPIQV